MSSRKATQEGEEAILKNLCLAGTVRPGRVVSSGSMAPLQGSVGAWVSERWAAWTRTAAHCSLAPTAQLPVPDPYRLAGNAQVAGN